MNEVLRREQFHTVDAKSDGHHPTGRAMDPVRIVLWGSFLAAIVCFWIIAAGYAFGLP
jgi:hypothetical protein